MYRRDTWVFRDSLEHEYKYPGQYGAKGEKRAEKKKATPEVIKKQNQYNREKNMRRLIKANFMPDDLWVTLKYPKGFRTTVEDVKGHVRKFLNKLRKIYKGKEAELKFVYRMEIGKRGGIHIHLLVNRISGCDIDKIIQQAWEHGRVWYANLDDGGYDKLANYIVKLPDEETCKQLSLFDEEEKKQLVKYSSSRNLIRPEPESKTYTRRTVRKLVDEIRTNGVPEATPGYYIDRDSVVAGINRYTGLSYIRYTEIALGG